MVEKNKGAICRFCGGVRSGWKVTSSYMPERFVGALYPCFCIDILTERVRNIEKLLGITVAPLKDVEAGKQTNNMPMRKRSSKKRKRTASA